MSMKTGMFKLLLSDTMEMGQSTENIAYQATRSTVIGKVEYIQGQWKMGQSTEIRHIRSARSSAIEKKNCVHNRSMDEGVT